MAKNSNTRSASRSVPTPKAAPASKGPSTSTATERLIRETAYFIAQREGFAPGRELEHWLQAERQVRNTFATSAK